MSGADDCDDTTRRCPMPTVYDELRPDASDWPDLSDIADGTLIESEHGIGMYFEGPLSAEDEAEIQRRLSVAYDIPLAGTDEPQRDDGGAK